MLVLAVAALKGGVGKSTIAINIAVPLHRAGHKVLIVDTDSQATCRSWANVASDNGHDGPPVVSIDGKSLRRDLPKLAAGFDVVVLDTPPRIGPEVRAAMLASDVVILPVTPGPADVWALRQTVDVLNDARDARPEIAAAVVINRSARTTLTSVTRKALDGLGVQVLPVSLSERVAFGEATARGLGVPDYAPDSQAASEVHALVDAVLATVQASKSNQVLPS